MTTNRFALFDTAIGRCGIAWGERGVTAVRLPEANDRAMRASLLRRCPGAKEGLPPLDVQHAIEGIVALLDGAARDLSGVVLDMNGVPPFDRQVYEIARTIPPGATLTYGDIAKRMGEPGAARDVGQALGHNPFPIVVPCHRVHAVGGKTGGFSAPGGVATKLRILQIESAHAKGTLFDLDRTL
ncbi:MAG: methylated-DNA--[protein]-cysteine S-methyltransferase [Xanthobacteraceae bacterium]